MSLHLSGLNVFCAILALTIAAAPASAEEIPWSTDIEASLRKAQTAGKPVLMEFTAPWCMYCKRMEKTTLVNPEVVAVIRQGFIPVRVDADQNQALVSDLQIKGLPAILIVSADLQIIERISGFQTPEALLPKLQTVLRRSAAPAQQPIMASRQEKPQRDSHPGAGQRTTDLEFEAIAQEKPRPSQKNSVQTVSNPRAVAQPERSEASVQGDDTHQFFEQLEAEKSQQAGPADSTVVTSPSKNSSSDAAFKGLCLVSAVEDRELVQGTPRVQVEYRGHVLYFRSEEYKQQFLADPTRYWPMLDGSCAMTLLDEGEDVEGNLKFAARFRRRIWLFSSEEKMQEFMVDPADVVESLAAEQGSSEE